MTDNGELVATLRFDVQRLFQDELDVIATLSTTPELSEEDDVNTINVRVAGQRIQLRERTAEKIFPSDERVNRREIVTPDRRQILTPYSRCLKRQESFPVSMISQ